MRVGLFVPCYIDQFYPDVAVSTVEVLTRLGVEVDFPEAQTCCGQPMANTGCTAQAEPLAHRAAEIFAPYTHVVCPSGSCTAMVRHHYDDYFRDRDDFGLRAKTYELCEFLHDVLEVESFGVRFPHRVGLHQSCHGLRELRLGWSSETMTARDDKVSRLLRRVEDLKLVTLKRADECCGFGGTFAVNEADVSVSMGRDRIDDHTNSGAEVMVAGDMSCLMHMEGLLRRSRHPLGVMHVAQVLAGRPLVRGNSMVRIGKD
jgi:L-lactate dehydrogenase complex protein LldE